MPPVTRLLADQVAYHARTLLRTPRAVVGGMLLPILLLLLRGSAPYVTHIEQVQLVAGLIAFGALSTAYITHTASLVAARQDGVLKRWRATPLPRWCYFVGRITAISLLTTIGGALTALVGGAQAHIDLSLGTLSALGLILILGSATWASLGTAASALIPTTEAAWPLLGLTYLPLVILSGSFGIVGGQPAWLATIIGELPVRPIIDSISRALATGGGMSSISPHDLAVLAAWTATGMLLSVRCFRWTPRPLGHRRGPARTYEERASSTT